MNTFADGNRHEGEYENDMLEGKGVFYYKNGDKFEGTWEDNNKHGVGKFTTASGFLKKSKTTT